MNRINTCLEKLWNGGVPVTCVALLVILLTISIVVTGVGLHSALVWIILASASVLCLALCSCVKCGKRFSRWRGARRGDADPNDRSDSISTVSDLTDFSQHPSAYSSTLPGLHIMYFGGGVPSFWRRDSLPDYEAVVGPDAMPPPYSAVGPPPADAEPPPYEAVISGQILRVVQDTPPPRTLTVSVPGPEDARARDAVKDNATPTESSEASEIEMQGMDDRVIIECPSEEDNSSC